MLALFTILASEGDGSGMPTTWAGTVTAIAFMILMGFMMWLFFKD